MKELFIVFYLFSKVYGSSEHGMTTENSMDHDSHHTMDSNTLSNSTFTVSTEDVYILISLSSVSLYIILSLCVWPLFRSNLYLNDKTILLLFLLPPIYIILFLVILTRSIFKIFSTNIC